MANSAVGRLIASARAAKQPRWTQAFLASELRRRAFPASRDQIARLERAAALRHDPHLLAAAVHALSIPAPLVREAIATDYDNIAAEVVAQLERLEPRI